MHFVKVCVSQWHRFGTSKEKKRTSTQKNTNKNGRTELSLTAEVNDSQLLLLLWTTAFLQPELLTLSVPSYCERVYLPLSPTLCSAQLCASVSVYQPACFSLSLNWWVQLAAAPLLFPAAWVVGFQCECEHVGVWNHETHQQWCRAPKSKTIFASSDHRNK